VKPSELPPLLLGIASAAFGGCSTAAPERGPSGVEFTVPPPGDDLRSRLERAADGTTFFLLEGEYTGQIAATARVTVRGAGIGRAHLRYAGKEPAVWAGTARVRLQNLTV
jgi:hypothetical protein